MKTILDYQFIDHGVCSSDYFQGQGTAYTKYDVSATGCADSCKEALADALDQLSCDGFSGPELDRLEAEITEEYADNERFEWDVSKFDGWEEPPEGEGEDSNIYYYFSILVQEGGLEREVVHAATGVR